MTRAKPKRPRLKGTQSLCNRAAKSRAHRKHVPITLPKVSAS